MPPTARKWKPISAEELQRRFEMDMTGLVHGSVPPPPLPAFALVPRSFRECAFQLQTGDVAVLDFVNAEPNTLKLVRASFDGYGCCDCAERVTTMNSGDAQKLIAMVETGELDQPTCRKIVVHYCRQQKAALWEDALEEHGLLRYE